MAIDPRKDTGRLALNKAAKDAAANAAAKAARNDAAAKQGAAVIKAQQAGAPVPIPKVTTPAPKTTPAPSTNLAGKSGAMSAIQSAINALANKAKANASSSSSKSSSSSGRISGGSSGMSSTGFKQVDTAYGAKAPTPPPAKAPIKYAGGRTGLIKNNVAAAKDTADRLEGIYNNYKVSDASKRIGQLGSQLSMPFINNQGFDAGLKVLGAGASKLTGNNVDLLKMRDSAADYANKELITSYGAGSRVAQGTGDNWDKFEVGATALGPLAIGARGVSKVAKGVSKVSDAIKMVDSADPALDMITKNRDWLRDIGNLPIDAFTKRLAPTNTANVIRDTGRVAEKAGLPAIRGTGDLATIQGRAPNVNFTMRNPSYTGGPAPSGKIPNVAGSAGDNMAAGIGKAGKAANAAPGGASKIPSGANYSSPAASLRKEMPNYTKVGPDLNDTAKFANVSGDAIDAAKSAGKWAAKNKGKLATGAVVGTGAGLYAAGMFAGADGGTASDPTAGMTDAEALDYYAGLAGAPQTSMMMATDGLAEDPLAAESQLSMQAPQTLSTGGGYSSGGYTPDYRGGGSAMGGGMGPGSFGLNGSQGGNAVETTYYTYDENGNMVDNIGYLIGDLAYMDPYGQQRVPEGAVVMTNNGQDVFQRTPEGSGQIMQNEDGTFNPDDLWNPWGQQEELPLEEEVTEDAIMEDIMSSYGPYLETQYAAIDAQVEQDILAMREQLAARGMFNSDVALSMEQKIREAGAQQKDALYGQILSEAYGMALEYKQNQDQMNLQSEQLAYQKSSDQRDFLEGQRQFAAQMGLSYDQLNLQDRQLLLDQEYKSQSLEIDRARLRISQSSGGGGGLTAYQQLQMYKDAQDQKYTALDTLMSSAQNDLAGGMNMEQISVRLNSRAQTLPGVTPDMLRTVVEGVYNTFKAGAY